MFEILKWALIIGVVIFAIAVVIMVTSVSAYKKSEKKKATEKFLAKPLEKLEEDNTEELAKKYEDK